VYRGRRHLAAVGYGDLSSGKRKIIEKQPDRVRRRRLWLTRAGLSRGLGSQIYEINRPIRLDYEVDSWFLEEKLSKFHRTTEQSACLEIHKKLIETGQEPTLRSIEAKVVGFEGEQKRVNGDFPDLRRALEPVRAEFGDIPAHRAGGDQKSKHRVQQQGSRRDLKILARQKTPDELFHFEIPSYLGRRYSD
jgi:hypothetical protein